MAKQSLRAEQGWIFDNFLMLSDNEDVLHPGIMGTRFDRGFKLEDLHAVYSKVTGRRSFPKSWAKRAAVLERFADSAKSKNRLETARSFYHRAALCYGRAQHLVPVHKDPNKEAWYAGLRRCFAVLVALSYGMIEQKIVEFRPGKSTYCNFHKAPGDGPKPTILYLPGMDQVKEDYPNPFKNEFGQRGMNICSMDGPGQGESNINAVWQDKDNYAIAAEKVIDWLITRDDVDPDRIGVFGTSMGSRWGVQVTAHDPRVKAVCGQMANVGTFDMIFEQAQPNFKRIFMYMAGHTDEGEFDKFVETLDQVPDLAKGVTVPHLLVAGDMDELCPPKDMATFRSELKGPKELWLYEGVFHPMGEVAAEIYPNIADWLLESLNEGRPAGYNQEVYIEEGTVLADYEHG
jgi:pimeloyl-ACP methyl ester carboxylesterase